jgi:hypothetical protein
VITGSIFFTQGIPMKKLALLLLLSTAAFAQNPDTAKYSSRELLLVDPTSGTEAIVPMLITVDGNQVLKYIPIREAKDSLEKGGKPVKLGDIMSLLNANTQSINKLQAENAQLKEDNDKLWKVAMKDAPKPETIVIQPAEPPAPTLAEIQAQREAQAQNQRQQNLQTWMMLQGRSQPQPYQLPMPVNPNANRLQTNCTTSTYGGATHTNCN